MVAIAPAPTSSRDLAEYRASGFASPTRLVWSLSVMTLVAAMLGLVYTLLVFYLPFLKLRGLATLGAGFGLGGLAVAVVRLGRVRSRTLAAGVGLWLFLVGYYLSWSFWPALAIEEVGETRLSIFAFFFSTPEAITGLAQGLLAEGFWLERDEPVQGAKLATVWILEIGLLLVPTLALASAATRSRPFCSACGTWCKHLHAVASLDDAVDADQLRRDLVGGDLGALAKLPPADFSAPTRLRVERDACPRCGESQFVSVTHVAFTTKNGNLTESKTPIVRHLAITPDQAAWVDRDLAAARPTSPAEPTTDDAEPAATA